VAAHLAEHEHHVIGLDHTPASAPPAGVQRLQGDLSTPGTLSAALADWPSCTDSLAPSPAGSFSRQPLRGLRRASRAIDQRNFARGTPLALLADSTRIRAELGWRPKINSPHDHRGRLDCAEQPVVARRIFDYGIVPI
jgi:hypothetical protein